MKRLSEQVNKARRVFKIKGAADLASVHKAHKQPRKQKSFGGYMHGQDSEEEKSEDVNSNDLSDPDRVFTKKHLWEYNLKPPEQRRLGRGNYVSILKRKKLEHTVYQEDDLDFDPITPVGGSIGRMLVNKDENYTIPE